MDSPTTNKISCASAREGVLCGTCKMGYRLNFFNNSCVKITQHCDDTLFVMYLLVYSVNISLLFVYLTDITLVLKRVWLWIKKHIKCLNTEGASMDLPISVIFQLFVYYYQLAHLLHVKVERQTSKNQFLQGVKSNITNFFYFHFVIHVHEKVCPTFPLTLLEKTAISLGFELSLLSNLLLIFLVVKMAKFLKRKIDITEPPLAPPVPPAT